MKTVLKNVPWHLSIIYVLSLFVLYINPSIASNHSKEVIVLTGNDLTLNDIIKIAENKADIEVSSDGMKRIKSARSVVDYYVDNKLPAYGITTMYGADYKTVLPLEQIQQVGRINILQEATRVGDGSQPILKKGVIRAGWAMLVNSYARGFSGASPELVQTLIDRINDNELPEDVEYGNSMGDADLIANNQAAASLFSIPNFKVGPGEATNLMTHNFFSVAKACIIANHTQQLLATAKVSYTLIMEGYRGNPSPLTMIPSRSGDKQKLVVQKDLTHLLEGSKLWEKDGPRDLQNYLSLRDSVNIFAATQVKLRRLIITLEKLANSNQGSPIIDVKSKQLFSITDFDTSEITLDMDALRQALRLMLIASNSRALKAMSRPFSDLPSGLATDDPFAFDGLYTRNITYLLTAITRDALSYTNSVTQMTESFIAEGDEDYSPPFPNSVQMAELLLERFEKVITIEALIGSFALERRILNKQLTKEDIPKHLQKVHAEIIKRSPMKIAVDQPYNLKDLLHYYINSYAPPPWLMNN